MESNVLVLVGPMEEARKVTAILLSNKIVGTVEDLYRRIDDAMRDTMKRKSFPTVMTEGQTRSFISKASLGIISAQKYGNKPFGSMEEAVAYGRMVAKESIGEHKLLKQLIDSFTDGYYAVLGVSDLEAVSKARSMLEKTRNRIGVINITEVTDKDYEEVLPKILDSIKSTWNNEKKRK